jgi:hypothetical protein
MPAYNNSSFLFLFNTVQGRYMIYTRMNCSLPKQQEGKEQRRAFRIF